MNTNAELLIEIKEGIATLIINRPEKKNSLSLNILESLGAFFTDPPSEVRAVVIRGVGDEAFSSGFDISTIGDSTPGAEGDFIEKSYACIRNSTLPTIAYLNGYAIGAACDLITNCDIRIANPRGRFGIPPAKLGVIYNYEGLGRFISLVGMANTKEMFLTGRIYSAEQSQKMGLINYIIDADQQAEEVYKMAAEIVNNAPLSIRAIKRMLIMQGDPAEQSQEIKQEIAEIRQQIFTSNDFREGKAAFLEKRKPRFTGS